MPLNYFDDAFCYIGTSKKYHGSLQYYLHLELVTTTLTGGKIKHVIRLSEGITMGNFYLR